MINNKTVDPSVEKLDLPMPPRLIAIYGPLNCRTFYLEEPVVSIGRLESNDIRLEDPFVSRHHCVIRNEGEQYLIEDLNSANGTFVNGERVDTGSLKEGSLIEIGGSQFIFRLQNPEDSIELSRNLVVTEEGRSPLDRVA